MRSDRTMALGNPAGKDMVNFDAPSPLAPVDALSGRKGTTGAR
jgi:hypothetical protein